MEFDTLLQSVAGITVGGHPVALYLTTAGGLCLAASTVMPPPKPTGSRAYAVAYGVVNFIAFNFGQARNANSPSNRK